MKKQLLALLLLAALATSTIATFSTFPTLSAQQTGMPTYPIIDAIPNPIGVGQQTLLRTGILQPLASVRYGWIGITITVIKPDNTTETLGPFTTDSTGVTFTSYTPTTTGTYKLITNFPEQQNPATYTDRERNAVIPAGTKMLASKSDPLELIVQADPLPDYPGHSLPTEYWSRPIDPQLREWFSVSGNWVARPDNSLALYNNDAPETPHVLWANDLTTGGLMGGLWGDGQIPASAETGDAYEGKFPGSVVMNGILYYQRTDTRSERAPAIIAVNMHTGEEWLFRNNTVLSFGQILYFNSYNYDGVFSYIWSVTTVGTNNTYTAYDPFTGNQQIQFTNVSSGTRFFGSSGEILILQTDYRNGWMALWNSTDAGLQLQDPNQSGYGSWGNSAHGLVFDGSKRACYSWNVTIPKTLGMTDTLLKSATKVYPDRLVGILFNQTMVRIWELNTKGLTNTSTTTTTILDKTWAPPAEWLTGLHTLHYTGATNNVEGGVIALFDKELRQHYGFSVETGSYLWKTESEFYSDAYGLGASEHTWYFAYGKLYSVGVGGILYAFDLTNGATAWTYVLDDPYNEPVTGENWWGWITLIADDKIYIGSIEHSAEQPLPRGAPQVCVNASNGAEIWRIDGMFRNTRWGGNGVIGDSIIATMDTYDQRVYAIGKGPTQTTADSPKAAINLGNSLVISGSVNDISPGLATTEMKLRFPNGVAAVSDDSQSQWMLYVYKQFERPTNVSGIEVSIDVMDGNGNFRNIGTTTTDSNGYYSYQWMPDIAGKYTAFVTFSGSKAYYGSFGETSFAVDTAAATATPQPTQPASMADLYFLPAIAGLFVALIVGFAVILIVIRKRP